MRTILLIDDDEAMRLTFGVMLRRHGYHVLEANSGLAGLEMARQHLPDLILSDIHMPGGDGSTLLRGLRRDPELRSKQIVLMTGKPELVTPRRGMEEGADDFLVKPVSKEALLGCIEARFNRASINWRVEDQMLKQLRSSVPSNLPHEFFTPMAGIIGLTEILRSGSAGFTPAEIADIAGDIHQSALRLNRTLRNYLLILESQRDQPALSLPSLSARQVEESIHLGVKEALQLNSRKNDVSMRIRACSLPMQTADLMSIVEELVDNACKFSRQGTQVEIEFDEEGRFTVTDQGRGMTSEEISRIGAFQQFDRKRHEQQGLGLGLVLVQRLASLQGAEMKISSQPGAGTSVQITFRKSDQLQSGPNPTTAKE
jgi:two-component system sensor histidine kinase/response regulator